MIPLTYIPKDKIREFQLSDDQWIKLISFIDVKEQHLIDGARHKLNLVIGTYLWSTFNDQNRIKPSDLAKPFRKMIKESKNLKSFLENYFFPSYLKYSDEMSSDVVKNRISGTTSPNERPLIREKPKKKTLDGLNTIQRNEMIRIALTQRLFLASMEGHRQIVQMETILKNLYELNLAAKKALDTLPSARGVRPTAKGVQGDPYLDRLIADAQIIYQDSGGKGFYPDNAKRFILVLMDYIADFTRHHIGADHADLLEKKANEYRLNGHLFKEKIKMVRRKQTGVGIGSKSFQK